MNSTKKHSFTYHRHPFFFLLLLQILIFLSKSKAQSLAKNKHLNLSVSAILVFGDSTADPGNNNYIRTPFKGNFPPYGRDFKDQIPTGRFTNGRLANDFIAEYAGIKEYVPPYLDPTLSIEELMTGVSFASAGSGFDPLTPKISNVIPLTKQLDYFEEYKRRLEVGIGKKRSKHLIENAFFLVSAGTNDFVLNYFALPIRRKSYSLPTYIDFLLQQVQHFMQGLWDEGARRIGVVGLAPMGCLPMVITFNSESPIKHRSCIDFYSSVARDYNLMLQIELSSMQFRLANVGARIKFLDIYEPMADMTQGHKFDFKEVSKGCCGTGLVEASFMCNPKSCLCPDASKYVFWDSIHPSEKTYYILFQALKSTIDSLLHN